MNQPVRRLRVVGGSAAEREIAAAEAFAAGASGLEERDGPPAELWIYAAEGCADRVRRALLGGPAALRVLDDGVEPVRTWSEAWKEGLEAVVVSPRLVVRQLRLHARYTRSGQD